MDITEEQIKAFKEEWKKADQEGDVGNRVRRGLGAAFATITDSHDGL